MAGNEVRNIERPTDLIHQNIVYVKTAIQQEMFGVKIFRKNVPGE